MIVMLFGHFLDLPAPYLIKLCFPPNNQCMADMQQLKQQQLICSIHTGREHTTLLLEEQDNDEQIASSVEYNENETEAYPVPF